MSISAELAAFSARTHTRELPPAVLARTRHLLLDLAGEHRSRPRGASDALEGKHGFLDAYAPAPQPPQREVQNLGSEFELMATGVKPYPSCPIRAHSYRIRPFARCSRRSAASTPLRWKLSSPPTCQAR